MFGRLALAALLAGTLIVAIGAIRPAVTEAQSPTCDLVAEAVFGASAGTLNTRVGVRGACDQPGALEVYLPGGHVLRSASADGQILISGFAPLCGTGPFSVEARYRTGADAWRGTLVVREEGSAEAFTWPESRCDAILQAGITAVAWDGATVSVEDGLSGVNLNGVSSAERVLAVWQFDALSQTWLLWASALPPSLRGFALFTTGTTYWFVLDEPGLELFLTFPEAP